MSQQDNIQIVKEIYDAVGRGDVEAILERVSDDSALTAQAFALSP
jgi:ketosteroid isomerase-like protein